MAGVRGGRIGKAFPDSYVCPYLFDLEQSALSYSPLSQFQGTIADRTDSLRLVHTLNVALDSPITSDFVSDKLFAKWWPDLEKEFADLRQYARRQKALVILPSQEEKIGAILS